MEETQVYIAECLWPSVTRSDADALDRRLALHGRAPVEHVGTTLVPDDDVIFVWFSAPDEIEVRALCLRASVPFDRVVATEGWHAALTAPSQKEDS